MKQYLKKLQTLYGLWKDFKEVIEKANPDFEQDFSQILAAIPPEYIPYFLQWMIDIGNVNIVSSNMDNIINSIVSYNQYRKTWIEETLTVLSGIEKTDIDKSISNNLMQIIKGPYKYGNTWVIFDLLKNVKNIGNSREIIEENYEEILQVVFSSNEFLSNNNEIILRIKDLINKLAQQEKVRLSDIEHIGKGQYSDCLRIGDTVVKFGKKRPLEKLPVHRRILNPLIRREIPSNYKKEIEEGNLKPKDVVAIECQSRVDTEWYKELSDQEIEEKLYMIYKDLRKSNIIWTDIKPDNVGRLIKPNVVENTIKDFRGEKVKKVSTLSIGELVIFDTDRIYNKGEVPKFDDDPAEKQKYQLFEERFCKEQEKSIE